MTERWMVRMALAATMLLASGLATAAEPQVIAKELQHHIKTIVGISTKVSVLDADALPRTLTGKAKRVFDTRPKQL